MNTETTQVVVSRRKFSGKQVILVVGLAMLVMALGVVLWINQYVNAAMFPPTRLGESEQQVLNVKMAHLLHTADSPSSSMSQPPSSTVNLPIEPVPYSEADASRQIQLTEREVNALIATDSYMARHMAVDMSDDLLSVQLVVPVKHEMPLVGGRMLKVNFGLALSYADGKPVVAMRGISLGGIPLPSAWWGDIKNTNLVEEFGGSGGFWDQFSKGVKDMKVQDGQLYVMLKE
ncbi:arginine N-succinyltransferase [Nitrospira sp. MA-1]|nr:arginine N-succinyltransferase [Nitrospira sp. MA-1]